MKLSTVQKAFVALIIANIIWGAASPIFKLSLQNIPPFTLAFWRFFLGFLMLLPFLGKRAAIHIASGQDMLLFLFYTVSGITINVIFFFWGLRLTYAINAPIIASAAPIVTLLVAMFFLREPFIWKKFLGMILGSIGILLIIFEPLLETGLDGSILGNMFLIVAMLGAVGMTVAGKDLFARYEPIPISLWAFLVASASFLPLAIYEYATIPNLYHSLDWRGYLGIGFGAVLSTTVAYVLNAWGLSKISATDTALFTYIDPIAGTILAVLILHEPITALFLLGALLIFGGIFLAEGRLHYHPIGRILHRHDQENLV